MLEQRGSEGPDGRAVPESDPLQLVEIPHGVGGPFRGEVVGVGNPAPWGLAGMARVKRMVPYVPLASNMACFGYEDIAPVMGWTLAKVKNEVHRARLELRTSLAGYLGGVR